MKKVLPIILIIVVVVAVFGFGTYKIYETKEAEKTETIQLAKLEEEKLAKAEAEKAAKLAEEKAETEKAAKLAEEKAEAEKLAKEAEAKAEAEKLAKEAEEKLAKEKAEAEAKGVEDLNIGTHYLDENKVESTTKPETKPTPKPETKPKPKPETKPETTKKDPYEKLGSFFDIPMYTQEQNEWAAEARDIWVNTADAIAGKEPSNPGLKAHAKMILEMIDLQIGDWNPKHYGWEYIDEEGGESIIIPGGSKMSGVGWD
ncbi:MAG: hypothetical protein RR710_02745 [Oscillospiraceae bacterium]